MSDGGKAAICKQITDEGYSEGYALVVHLLALMGPDLTGLGPESLEELAEWRGHLKGLRAALFCIVMHERRIGPESAALIVKQHVEFATSVLNDPGEAEGGDEPCPTGR
jgi:hypothetical protein